MTQTRFVPRTLNCRIGVILFLLTAPIVAANSIVEITSKNGSAPELDTAAQLRRILDQYRVGHLVTTKTVLVDAQAIPHSHPILTVNTKYPDSDAHLLTTFIHEQLHWFLSAQQTQVSAAIADFRQEFPEVPVGRGQGARDEHSTYLHLIVCDLELQALTALIGEQEARSVIADADHYRWIYKQILENRSVRAINSRHGLKAPEPTVDR